MRTIYIVFITFLMSFQYVTAEDCTSSLSANPLEADVCSPKLSTAAQKNIKTVTKAPSAMTTVKTIMERYQKAKSAKIDLKKKVKLAILDEEKESEGSLIISKGRLRLEIAKPEPSLLVVNKDVIWVESPAPTELGHTQVLKISSREFAKQSKAPLAMILGQSRVWDRFKIENENTKGDKLSVTLVPKEKGGMGEVVQLALTLDKKDRKILLLSYKDELENETLFDFTNSDFSAQVDESKMQYKPPKLAEVTEY